ncbi:MAG: hypothetical protein LBR22_08475 [Desulfovibrio sp.]|jgi:uncharacterized lipoprotein YajG|nr:hypothetical protein [Desulfovibrio sp.]
MMQRIERQGMLRPGILHCLILAATLLLGACGPSNTVRLLPPPPLEASLLPTANAARVTVVTFVDRREDITAIGVRRDGTAFETQGNLTEWVTSAMADALAHMGLQVSIAQTVNQARAGTPDYLVTGELQQVWLKETSTMDMSAVMRMDYTLANKEKRVVRDNYSASQSRSGLPSNTMAEKLLQDTLNDMVRPVADKIYRAVRTKK